MSYTILGVTLIVMGSVFEGLGQVFLKKSSMHERRRILWLVLGMVLLGGEVFLYMASLRFVPVGVAFALGGLSFVTVTIFARIILHERILFMRWVGVILILFGAGMIVAYV